MADTKAKTNAKDTDKDTEATAAAPVTATERRRPATEAETERVRTAWREGKRIPAGFYCKYIQQGGETVLSVTKKA